MKRYQYTLLALLLSATVVTAMPPGASYIFPAGGQRGQTVKVRVGGLVTHDRCPWEMLGTGIAPGKELTRGTTLWIEGPRLPLPDSQRVEDYPQDMMGEVKIAADAPLGLRSWRLWTSQGISPNKRFVVGDFPEIIEEEGDREPVAIKYPVTINGRIFPRENVDVWTFTARKGQSITCVVVAEAIGSPLDARLEIRDARGKLLVENEDFRGLDPLIRFVPPADGTYQVRIHDVRFQGSQSHVYRLTVTDTPVVESVYPLGAKRGSKLALQLTGQGLPAQPVTLDVPAKATTGEEFTVEVNGKRSLPFTLDLDDLPEVLRDARREGTLSVPCVLNGRIEKPGAIDSWQFTAKKGERWLLEMRAARLGSPLNGVLTILDAGGKPLTKADSGDDPVLRFTAPADGTYTLQVSERYRSQGAYRVRLTIEEPDFQLNVVADTVTVLRGATTPLKVQVERRGDFKQPIALTIQGLPDDVKVNPITIQPNQNQIDIPLKADAAAKVRVSRLIIQGTAQSLVRTANVSGADHVALAVGVPTPFKIVGDFDMTNLPRGSVQKRKYRIERNDYTGPLTITLADRQARHLQGVTGPTFTLSAETKEFEYPVTLPPWMEIGRTCRVCIQGTGTVQDADGTKHLVCYSSVNQNEQFVTVIATGRLDVVVDRSSVTAKPGEEVALAVRVLRDKGLQGAVKVELIYPASFTGIKCEPLTIAADRGEGTVKLTFTQGRLPSRTLPVLVRATLTSKEGPIVAETRLDVSAP